MNEDIEMNLRWILTWMKILKQLDTSLTEKIEIRQQKDQKFEKA